MITKLPSRHWHQLEEIFQTTFDSDLPDENSDAEIFVLNENGKRVGFILAENIKMVGQIYVYPEFRKDSAKNALTMVKFVQGKYQDIPVGAVASETRFEKFYKLLGMEKIEGSFFRKN